MEPTVIVKHKEVPGTEGPRHLETRKNFDRLER